MGIWDEAYLEQSAETGLLSCRVAPEVADDLGTAWLDAEVSVTRNTRIAFELWDDEGNRCLRRERQTEDCRAGCRLTVVSPAFMVAGRCRPAAAVYAAGSGTRRSA